MKSLMRVAIPALLVITTIAGCSSTPPVSTPEPTPVSTSTTTPKPPTEGDTTVVLKVSNPNGVPITFIAEDNERRDEYIESTTDREIVRTWNVDPEVSKTIKLAALPVNHSAEGFENAVTCSISVDGVEVVYQDTPFVESPGSADYSMYCVYDFVG